MSENAKRRALLEKQKNGYDVMSAEELKACHEFNEDYKYFIDAAKTEREAVDYAVEAAKAAGFKPYKRGDKLKPGDKILSGQPRQGNRRYGNRPARRA